MSCFYEEFLKKESITGMIFDVDGTLLDAMPVWDHSGERYLKTLGIDAPPSLGKILFSKTMQQGAVYLKQTYCIPQSEEEIQAGIRKVVAHAYQHEVPLKRSARAFLEALKAAKKPMAVVTSTDRELILPAFRRLSLLNYFQEIITCSEFGSGKDQPEIFDTASKQIQSSPASTWVVEDGLYAIRTAKTAGYPVIGVADASSKEDEPQIRQLANYFVTDFAQSSNFI